VRLAPFLCVASASTIVLAGCTALVAPPDDRIRCEITDGVDPCPTGSRCLEGHCTADCMPTEIGCNDIDDNCNGATDEGSDMDGDTFEWCASDPSLRDCVDDNGIIHPDGPKIPAPEDPPCDGADNDCSGSATECESPRVCHLGDCLMPDCTFGGVFNCPPGERCNDELAPPRCEDTVEDCMLPGMECEDGLVCNPRSRTCQPPGGIGEPCEDDSVCQDGLVCIENDAVRLVEADVGGERFCSRSCCTDDDCDGAVCYASGSGARACVPEEVLALGPEGVPDEEACTERGHCSDECVAAIRPAYREPTRPAFACEPPLGLGAFDDFCFSADDCETGLCVGGFCSQACGNTASCGDSSFRCGWVTIADREDFLTACVYSPATSTTDGATGEACETYISCRDGACLEDTAGGRYCAGACCAASHCPGGYSCRPVRIAARFENRCVRD
jgi:hypothetical protein